MQMAAKTVRPPVSVPEKIEHRLKQFDVIAGLQTAVEEVEHALHDLRDLAKRPGYEFAGRMIPGYVWAVEQLHELNTGLAEKCDAAARADREES